ncbi:hypothetical protein SK128_014450 [Halocaridina rubra]|uniref:Uncharacterized protein n=1 Tax=Halocaridina rubra TaxID=373956 RepID=A0AAN8WRU9_HALRR
MGKVLLLACWLCFLDVAFGIAAIGLTSYPYTTAESCASTLTDSECQLRRAECGVVNSILQASGGPINSVLECAEIVGVTVDPAVFTFLGTDFLTGIPPSITELIEADPTSLAALRYCTLNATGLVLENGKLDRVELVERFETQLFYVPSVSSALVEAANICPEPEEYKVETFMGCLRASCLQAGVPLPLSAEDLDPSPRQKLTLSILPTSVPLNTGFWMM